MVPASARSGNPAELIIYYRAGDAALEISYTLRDEYAVARMLVPASDEIRFASLPGSFLPEGERLKLLLPIMQGMLWDGRGPSEAMRAEAVYRFSSRLLVLPNAAVCCDAESRTTGWWWQVQAA